MLQVVELSSLGKWESREKKKEGQAKELAEGLDTLPGGSSWSPRPSRLSSGGECGASMAGTGWEHQWGSMATGRCKGLKLGFIQKYLYSSLGPFLGAANQDE